MQHCAVSNENFSINAASWFKICSHVSQFCYPIRLIRFENLIYRKYLVNVYHRLELVYEAKLDANVCGFSVNTPRGY